MSQYVSLLRVKHYIKNLFIFLPLFFAAKITHQISFIYSIVAFAAFSLAASSIYILNDYLDIEEDRRHPTKRYRPLALGSVKTAHAFVLMVLLFCVGSVVMAALSWNACIILWVYVIMNIAYSLYIKKIAIMDVTIIAIGFVLRLFVGSAVTGIMLSKWIVVLTFLLALFIALAKRRDDLLILNDTGQSMRKANDGYNLEFINATMIIMASVVIVAYTLYTTSTEVIERFGSNHLYLTALFVVLGIMRYMQITFVFKDSGSPTKVLFKDRFMQITLVIWIATFIWIIYL
ncbi:UbiA prenyltransferase family protein [bacterium]|nr:UbiA prenyltransferase family protein [bacterium]